MHPLDVPRTHRRGAIAFVAIGATINIVLISREDEVAIVKMVGATRAFIARPFVIERCRQCISLWTIAVAVAAFVLNVIA